MSTLSTDPEVLVSLSIVVECPRLCGVLHNYSRPIHTISVSGHHCVAESEQPKELMNVCV